MALYIDLFPITQDPDFINRVRVACVVAADGIRSESPSTPYYDRRKRWAREVLRESEAVARSVVWAIVAQYNGMSVSQISGATDEQLLQAVQASMPVLIET